MCVCGGGGGGFTRAGLSVIGYPLGDNHNRVGNRTRLYGVSFECTPFSFGKSRYYFPVLLYFGAPNVTVLHVIARV